MPTITIDRVIDPADEDRDAILQPILAYNLSKAGEENYKKLALFLRDEHGTVQGGLWAKRYYDWVFVDLLFVPEDLRGQDMGTDLLGQTENWARSEGCVGVWLDTFAFQAPGFYLKRGYTVFGELPNYPKPFSRFFFSKVF